MSRHEREVRAVRRLPDGTVEELWTRESYDDDPPRPLAIAPAPAARGRAVVMGGVAAVFAAIVVGVPVVAQAVLP